MVGRKRRINHGGTRRKKQMKNEEGKMKNEGREKRKEKREKREECE